MIFIGSLSRQGKTSSGKRTGHGTKSNQFIQEDINNSQQYGDSQYFVYLWFYSYET